MHYDSLALFYTEKMRLFRISGFAKFLSSNSVFLTRQLWFMLVMLYRDLLAWYVMASTVFYLSTVGRSC